MLAALTISLLTLNGSGLFCSFRCFSPVKDGWLPNSLPNSIRILSYNFFLRPPLISSGRKGDYKNERLKTFIQTQLHLYDIICFQEVFQFASFRRSELVKEAASRGFKYHAAAPAALIDGGLLIISRFPIRSCAFKSYSRGIHSDFLANKGVLYAQIVLNDGIWWWCFCCRGSCCHLFAIKGPNGFFTFCNFYCLNEPVAILEGN